MIELGDRIHLALSSIGVTSDRVKQWLGVECHCEERRQKLNALDRWAQRVLKGIRDNHLNHLEEMVHADDSRRD